MYIALLIFQFGMFCFAASEPDSSDAEERRIQAAKGIDFFGYAVVLLVGFVAVYEIFGYNILKLLELVPLWPLLAAAWSLSAFELIFSRKRTEKSKEFS